MNKLVFWSLVLLVTCVLATTVIAEETAPYLVQTMGVECQHGLHKQPKGPFSVFVFCDDALASNIGVVLTEPGADPGKIELDGNKVWDDWNPTKRFWQEDQWSADVVNFLWSPSLKYLYVATDRIYGDGGFFRLDLVNRKAERLLPVETADYMPRLKNEDYYTKIEKVSIETNTMMIGIYISGESSDISVATEALPIE